MKRKWALIRVGGTYSQHAHFFSEKEARKCEELIKKNRKPRAKKYKSAMKRILTNEEYKNLKQKECYININKGVKR